VKYEAFQGHKFDRAMPDMLRTTSGAPGFLKGRRRAFLLDALPGPVLPWLSGFTRFASAIREA
jgi:hypothetical protein